MSNVPKTAVSPTDIKSKRGRRKRHVDESNVRALEHALMRLGGRYRGLSRFEGALAIWREFTQADVLPLPVLIEFRPYDRALLEQRFAEREEELEERLGRRPHVTELARCVAELYRPKHRTAPERRVRKTAEKQIERLLTAAGEHEYWSGVPAQWIPFTGLRVRKQVAEEFWHWYDATFHGR